MRSCCIFHEFLTSATKDPRRVAIVHAGGGLQVLREYRTRLNEASSSSNPASIPTSDLNFDAGHISSSPRFFPGDECFTYEELLSAVDSLSRRIRCVLDDGNAAHLLNHPGYGLISPEGLDLDESYMFGLPSVSCTPHIVGVRIGPSVEYIVAVLSILRCGEAFLPLDPSWPEERILSVVSSSRTRLVIQVKDDSSMKYGGRPTDGGGADWVDGCGSLVLYFSMKEKLLKNVAQATNLVWPCESSRQRKFCYLMYSSGSTGEPKGVCGTELGLLNRYWWMQDQYPISQEDVLLFKTSISFVDHLQEFLGAILACALLVIPPYHKLKYPEYTFDFLKAYGISRLTTVPSLVRELLPSFDISPCAQLIKSLKVLVLSGEILTISLWRDLHDRLLETTILNLYGSTEVAGDCACFDCKNMPDILEAEVLSSVPIGKPISNCGIDLLGERSKDNVGEICVSGMCLFAGYIGEIYHGQMLRDDRTQLHFKTGDRARRLPSGDFVFLGREDRIVKVRGQRISLEEIENVLREHPAIRDAAVIVQNTNGDCCHVEAFFVVRTTDECSEGAVTCVNRDDNEELIASIKSWLLRKLPPAMLPAILVRTEMLPKTSSGKIDYSMLRSSTYAPMKLRREYKLNISDNHRLQVVKKAFLAALPVEDVSDDDDFFMIGGNSISAAHVAYNLGIDMRLLYVFPSPFRLLKALLDMKQNGGLSNTDDMFEKTLRVDKSMLSSFELTRDFRNNKLFGELVEENSGIRIYDLVKLNESQITNLPKKNERLTSCDESRKITYFRSSPYGDLSSNMDDPWLSNCGLPRMCSFSRCNSIMVGSESLLKPKLQGCKSLEFTMHGRGHIQELWKVLLESCVDASPVVMLKDGNVFLFIGSHSQIFLCIDAFSGFVRWQAILEGRIECSAAITGDFSQVVVGCYKGKVYFLDCITGSILWSFQTSGEVKTQPAVDEDRGLIWCGSHDHHLYALDYKRHLCVSKILCGGSIYGSPAIDKVNIWIMLRFQFLLSSSYVTMKSRMCIIYFHVDLPVHDNLDILFAF
ncbi:hypothetical protein M5K25_001702 [Dendrobium thyrsiflorum]|uniref:4-coumarate--CoA ligase n=1 Tax=Dendrobium thyrsiflorum TaxID=117978 RepID=A0ABD0VR01_DENTH